MAEISKFISSEGEKQVQQYQSDLTKIVELYSKMGVASSKAANEAAIANKKLYDEAKKNTEQINKRKKANEDLSGEQKRLNEIAKESERINKGLATTSAKLVTAQTKENVRLQQKKKELTEVNKTIKVQNVLNDKNSGTLEKIRAKNALLRKERDKLNLSTKKGQKRLKEINKTLDKNNAFVNKNSDALKKQKINIGNYTSAFGPMGNALSTALKGLKSFGRSMLALLANPIVAIVAAIAGAFLLLRSAFLRTQEGQDKLGRGMAALKAVFAVIADRLGDFAIAIVDAFENPQKAVGDLWIAIKKNIVNRIKGVADTFKFLGKIINASLHFNFDEVKKQSKNLGESIVQSLTGVDDLANKVKDGYEGIKDEMIDEAKAAAELERSHQKVLDREISLIKTKALLKKEIAELKNSEKDSNLTIDDRIAILNKVIQKEDELTKLNVSIAKEKARIVRQQVSLGKSTRDDLKKAAELEAEAIDIAAAGVQAKKRSLSTIEGLERKKVTVAINTAKSASNAVKRGAIDEERILINSLKNKEISYSQYQTKRLQLTEQTNRKGLEAELVILKEQLLNFKSGSELYIQVKKEISNRELAIEKSKNKEILNERKIAEQEQKRTAAALVAQSVSAATQEAKERDNILKTQLARGVITEKQYQDEIYKIKNDAINQQLKNLKSQIDKIEETNAEKIKLETKYNELLQKQSDATTEHNIANLEKENEEKKRLKREEIDYSAEITRTLAAASFEAKQQELDQELKKEQDKSAIKLQELEKQKEQGLITEDQYAAEKEKIDISLAKKEGEIKTKKAKADRTAALFDIAINTAVAVSKVWGQTGIFGLAAQIPVLIMGALQAGVVLSKPIPKYSTGTESAANTFIAGEEGREIIIHKGKSVIAEEPTLFTNMAGARVLTNKETERLMNGRSGGEIVTDERMLNELKSINKNVNRRIVVNSRKKTITDRQGNYWKNYYNRIVE